MKKNFDVTGMNCAACSASVERSVRALGVENASVNLLSGRLTVEYDETKISDDEIKSAVKKAGFGIENAKSASEKRRILQENAKKAQRNLLTRLILSVAIMIVLMYFSMGHMLNLPTPSFLRENVLFSAIIQLILTLPILIINRAYFTNGFKHLFAKSPNMDSLIAVGSSAGFIYGIFATVQIVFGNVHYAHDLYFETSAMIPTIVTIGKFLEGKSRAGTGKALDMLIDLTPKKVTVLLDGEEKQIDVSLLKKNDIVLIKPGESFACDGKVMIGESYADESSLTGESIPVFKTVGDKVNAGTVNQTGALTVRAEKVGEDTVISEIIRLVEDASGSKAAISRLADKISGVFVPIVIAISLLTFIAWMIFSKNFEFAFSRAICVLVISCPCALGLATPVAVTVGTGVAASNGILIKSASTLEEMGKTNVVLFDKTGTLTKGAPEVTDIICKNKSENEFLTLCASIEAKSEHPLGTAIVNEAKTRGLAICETELYTALPGLGLEATIESRKYYAGNLKLLQEKGCKISNEVLSQYEKLCSDGKTPMFFTNESEYLGCIAVADKEKDDAKRAVEKLTEMKIKTVMLTGDNEITANAVAKKLGIEEVCAFVSPSQKEEYVKEYQNSGVVAMCGDGINDSPALARANIGISVAQGTDIALDVSDVVLMHSDVYSLARAIALSRATISNIKLSLFWALFYNSLGIPIAAGVLYPAFGIVLNPMIGAIAMSLSSICVVTNALRLRKFKFN